MLRRWSGTADAARRSETTSRPSAGVGSPSATSDNRPHPSGPCSGSRSRSTTGGDPRPSSSVRSVGYRLVFVQSWASGHAQLGSSSRGLDQAAAPASGVFERCLRTVPSVRARTNSPCGRLRCDPFRKHRNRSKKRGRTGRRSSAPPGKDCRCLRLQAAAAQLYA